MRKHLLVFATGLIFFGLTAFARSQCPEDPNDSGVCDTFYVEVYPDDQVNLPDSFFLVRVPFYVTHDVPDPQIDSISAFVIFLCYQHTNPDKYCSLTNYWNNVSLPPFPGTDRSVFRHFIEGEDTLIHNWMMDLSQQDLLLEWDTRALNLDGTSHFWFALYPTGSEDQRFGEGSRVLLATMTFKVQDTTTICIDSCFAPIPIGPLKFTRSDACSYVPRHNMPYCFSVQVSDRGDANGDGQVNVSDALYMLNYLFRHGPPPVSFEAGDANCDDDHGAMDVIFLLNYLFRGGPAPGCP
ncbi:MAG: hypothetical protein GTO24_22910 [candidate division Zixibacteria bacterium]|nr:hypothetical protein [candidate division Zixibacteria bacterium]